MHTHADPRVNVGWLLYTRVTLSKWAATKTIMIAETKTGPLHFLVPEKTCSFLLEPDSQGGLQIGTSIWPFSAGLESLGWLLR